MTCKRRDNHHSEAWNKLMSCREAGMSDAEIGAFFGITLAAVLDILAEGK